MAGKQLLMSRVSEGILDIKQAYRQQTAVPDWVRSTAILYGHAHR